MENCDECIDKALDDANIDMDEIDDVVIVGSSTNIPFVKKWLLSTFEDYDINLDSSARDSAIALGAIYKAKEQEGKYE